VRRASSWEETSVATALDLVAEKILAAPRGSAFLATPQATNEDVFLFKRLSERAGGLLDFRVGNPQERTQVREDNVLLRADRNPNTTGCLDQGVGVSGVDAILKACAAGTVKVLVLQGADLLKDAGVAAAVAKVPFVAVMASHEHAGAGFRALRLARRGVGGSGRDLHQLPAPRAADQARGRGLPVPPCRGGSWPRVSFTRLGESLSLSSAREVFALIAKDVKVYAGLDHRLVGATGRAVGGPTPASQEARA
jgi:hypothetical protein